MTPPDNSRIGQFFSRFLKKPEDDDPRVISYTSLKALSIPDPLVIDTAAEPERVAQALEAAADSCSLQSRHLPSLDEIKKRKELGQDTAIDIQALRNHGSHRWLQAKEALRAGRPPTAALDTQTVNPRAWLQAGKSGGGDAMPAEARELSPEELIRRKEMGQDTSIDVEAIKQQAAARMKISAEVNPTSPPPAPPGNRPARKNNRWFK